MADRHAFLECRVCGSATRLILSRFSSPRTHATPPDSRPELTSKPSSPTAIFFENTTQENVRGVTIKDISIENFGTGISMPAKAEIETINPTFSNVQKPIEIRGEDE
jgi:hypothetical protein